MSKRIEAPACRVVSVPAKLPSWPIMAIRLDCEHPKRAVQVSRGKSRIYTRILWAIRKIHRLDADVTRVVASLDHSQKALDIRDVLAVDLDDKDGCAQVIHVCRRAIVPVRAVDEAGYVAALLQDGAVRFLQNDASPSNDSVSLTRRQRHCRHVHLQNPAFAYNVLFANDETLRQNETKQQKRTIATALATSSQSRSW